ncbi:MAG: hypothetical protein JWO11_3512 [Nocardioides sp.]|nr:hypothetical protein [Nocardioides sp.]
MRRLLVAGIAALAVVLGLVVSTGVASAAPSALPCARDAASAQPAGCGGEHRPTGPGLNVGLDANLNLGTTVVPCPAHEHRVPGGACVPDGVGFPGHPGGPRGGHFPGYGLPIGGYQGLPVLVNGNIIVLDGGLQANVCSYSTWDGFNGRFGSHLGGLRGRFGHSPAAAWAQLRAQAACNAAVVNGLSGLTLVDGSYLNLGGEFGTVNVCSFSTFNDFGNRFGGRFGNRFNGVRGRFGGNPLGAWNQLRNQASCGNTVVVVPSSTTVVQAPAATAEALPADPSTTAPSADDGASKPLTSSPVPSGPVQTGGDSAAYVLAHARAV